MVYTCPMHPEIRRQGPGDCPICGMALEPAGVPAEEDENPELIAMSRRFWVSTVLALTPNSSRCLDGFGSARYSHCRCLF